MLQHNRSIESGNVGSRPQIPAGHSPQQLDQDGRREDSSYLLTDPSGWPRRTQAGTAVAVAMLVSGAVFAITSAARVKYAPRYVSVPTFPINRDLFLYLPMINHDEVGALTCFTPQDSRCSIDQDRARVDHLPFDRIHGGWSPRPE